MNKTIQTLDVSDNSFGKPQVGDQVKIKSSGEICSVTEFRKDTGVKTSASTSSSGYVTGYFLDADYTFDSQIPAFCAGVAASPSLISVSTIFRHSLAVSISHSSPLSYHVRSFMLMAMPSAKPAEKRSWRP